LGLAVPNECALSHALARGEAIDPESTTFKSLRDDNFVVDQDGARVRVSVFFARWSCRSVPR